MAVAIRVLVNLVFGILPTLTFFWWAFHGCRLPVHIEILLSVEAAVGCNMVLFLAFGTIHTYLAGLRIDRTLYVVIAGLTSAAVITLWQTTPVELWQLTGERFAWWFGTTQFVVWLAGHMWIVSTIGLPQFLGWKEPDTKKLVTGGPFKYVRHPMHLSILVNLAVCPVMTLDRATLLVAVATYLTAAVHDEEERLSEEYGLEWRVYRNRTPALVPGFWR